MTDAGGAPRMEPRALALHALFIADPQDKVAAVLATAGQSPSFWIAAQAPKPTSPAALPGRPERPQLVHPASVPRRSPSSAQGLAALLHAIAHIEFNAIKNAACSIPSRHVQFSVQGLSA